MQAFILIFFTVILTTTVSSQAAPSYQCINKSTPNQWPAEDLEAGTQGDGMQRLSRLKKFLKEDDTDSFHYNGNTNDELNWFVCNHFATQVFLRKSIFASLNAFVELEAKTPLRYLKNAAPESERLPLFYLSIAQDSGQFSHAINALYTGEGNTGYSQLSNYVFFEPQNDEVFFDLNSLLNHYLSPDQTAVTEVDLVIPTGVGHTDDGSLQFLNSTVASFSCKPDASFRP